MIRILLFVLALSPCFADNQAKVLLQKFQSGIPQWMKEQADQDLSGMSNCPISMKKICEYYDMSAPDLYLIKFTIRNNQVYVECKEKNSPGLDYRRRAYEEALQTISSVVHIPDTVFLISMHDSFTLSTEVPVFSMCKRRQDQWAISVPDFEALRAKFQVLSDADLTKYEPSWARKKNRLMWRGSTAQGSLDGELMRADNVHRFSRVILCKLSQQYPRLIDAKFTFFAQGGENIPSLQAYSSEMVSFEKQIQYKYHIYVDGNVSPYTGSGWKFFINSLIFKPDSPWTQWYYDALKPFEHYVPVKMDLEDLVEKVQWAISHDVEASRIAKNCRNFALSHITLPDNLLYLYYIIYRYSNLSFVD